MHYIVNMSHERIATINGEFLTLTPGQPSINAVLDRLHAYAIENAAAVEATINDPDTGHFVLEILPDGSSRYSNVPDTSAPQSKNMAASGPAHPVASGQMVTGGPHLTEAAYAVAEMPTLPAPAEAYDTRIVQTGRPATESMPDGPPYTYGSQISHIRVLLASGQLNEAYVLATDLRERLTEQVGVEDSEAVEARALEAYIAHLRGDHREAVALALAVARIRCSAGDLRAPEEVERATAAWCRLNGRAALVHGRELLNMWVQLNRRGILSPQHHALADRIRHRMASLRAVPSSPVDQRAASDAVHRKAEGRPHTGRIRAILQRGEVP